MIEFIFSQQQSYVLEIGEKWDNPDATWVNFYTEGQYVEWSPGVPLGYELPYHPDDIWELDYAQSTDTLFLVHPDYEPRDNQALW